MNYCLRWTSNCARVGLFMGNCLTSSIVTITKPPAVLLLFLNALSPSIQMGSDAMSRKAIEDVFADPAVPDLSRMLEAVSGLKAWSPDELKIRESKPAWFIYEAQACFAGAMLEDQPEGGTAMLKKALECVKHLPSSQIGRAACAYLVTFLPTELRQQFEALSAPELDAWEKEEREGALRN
ncbi:MAG: hypothetical protein JNK76_24070 [Planctomycetales bacterium]|nr:hypothetical protein [Planctomycetales bacterium]